MKIILLIISAITIASTDKCVYVLNNEKYSREEIISIEGLPTNLAYNNKTGQLFFTLIDIPSLLNDSVETEMAQYVIKDGKPIKIENFNGQTALVDSESGAVLFGSDKGIYIFEDSSNSAYPLALPDKDIVQLSQAPKSEDIYAIFYPSREIYIINDDGVVKRKLSDLTANIIAVDAEGNLFFQNDERGLCVLLNGFSEPITYVGLKVDTGRVLTTDGKRVIAATADGLYHLPTDNVIPKKLADFEFVPSGLVVFEDVYYISTSGKIFKYTKNDC